VPSAGAKLPFVPYDPYVVIRVNGKWVYDSDGSLLRAFLKREERERSFIMDFLAQRKFEEAYRECVLAEAKEPGMLIGDLLGDAELLTGRTEQFYREVVSNYQYSLQHSDREGIDEGLSLAFALNDQVFPGQYDECLRYLKKAEISEVHPYVLPKEGAMVSAKEVAVINYLWLSYQSQREVAPLYIQKALELDPDNASIAIHLMWFDELISQFASAHKLAEVWAPRVTETYMKKAFARALIEDAGKPDTTLRVPNPFAPRAP
jgi:tetratricopeptide (TPR) repeat protein